MGKQTRNAGMSEGPSPADGLHLERLRIALTVFLSKRPAGELVRIIMDWLPDDELPGFCRRYMDQQELDYLEHHGR
jgi:hypothetical protein